MAYLAPSEQRLPSAPAAEGSLLHEVEHWGMLAQAKEAALALPQIWNFSAGGGSIIGGPAALGSGVVFGGCDKQVYAVGSAGRQEWRFGIGSIIAASPVVADGIFVGGYDGRFYALEPDGRLRWIVPVRGPVFGSAAVQDNVLFFGTKGGTAYAVDSAGRVRWTFATRGPVSCTPVLADGVLAVASWDKTVYGLEPATGKELWRFTANELVANLAAQRDLIVFGSYDRACYGLGSDGKLAWRAALGGPVFGAPALAGNRAFVPCLDKSVYCLENGSIAWRWQSTDVIDSTPVAANGKVFVGGNDNSIAALSFRGELIWKQATNGPLLAARPLVHSDRLYAGCYDCNLYCLDLVTGRALWKFRTSSGHTSHIEVDVPALALRQQRLVSQELAPAAEKGAESAGSGGYRPLLGSGEMGVYATAEAEHPMSQYSGKAALEGPEDHHAPKKKGYAQC